MKAVHFICLFLAACAPAKLERVRHPDARRVSESSALARALARAFDGATDEAAMRSLGRWIERNHERGPTTALPGYRVSYHPGGPGIFPPDYFERLEPTASYRVRGLDEHREDGIGVTMAGVRENQGRSAVEKWYPPEAITRAVTAVAVPGTMKDGVRPVEIRLIDRLHTETVGIGGKRAHLAADFTVPFGALLERTAPLQSSGITAMLRQHADREPGFALMEPYDPNRTPLILIHGLLSTPLAWAELTNELWAVPEIRRRYQIWHYLYPTNPPALYSARIMRGKLDELRGFLDPDGNDPAMRRSVVIGHSMGGLLAKSLAVEPREAFWDAVFTRPLASLDLTDAERATMREAFYWQPRGNVDRIIFCSVPFRGSRIASSWIGRLGSALTAPSSQFEEFFTRVEQKNPGVFQPYYASLGQGKLTSVMTLSPGQRSMEIFDSLPLTANTSAHIITGSMDFVVQRSSATVANAESNIEVPAGHGSFHHPKAIEEIIRILKLPPVRTHRPAQN